MASHNSRMPSMDFGERLHNIAPGVFPDGLRPAQAHVLDRFAKDHTGTSDVGIELPTGEGKTPIGLLIADWALDEQVGCLPNWDPPARRPGHGPGRLPVRTGHAPLLRGQLPRS